jgi:hypothetical protein
VEALGGHFNEEYPIVVEPDEETFTFRKEAQVPAAR